MNYHLNMDEEVFYVTGATGWVGYNVVKELLSRKKEVVIFAIKNDRFLTHFYDVKEKITIFEGDIRKKEDCETFLSLKATLKTIQKVIHCAGIVTVEKKFNQMVYDVNVKGTKNIADVSLARHVDHFVYVSTTNVFKNTPKKEIVYETKNFVSDDKTGLYAITKSEATSYVLDLSEKGLNCSVIHPSAIIGPRDYMNGLMTSMILMFLQGKLPASVNGAYDLVDVRDVANALISASYQGKQGENYIIAGHQRKITALINEVAALTNKKKMRFTLPYWFVSLVTPLYEWYCHKKGMKVLYTKNALLAVKSNSNFSIKKAKEDLNYSPRPLEETLVDTILDLKSRYPELKVEIKNGEI